MTGLDEQATPRTGRPYSSTARADVNAVAVDSASPAVGTFDTVATEAAHSGGYLRSAVAAQTAVRAETALVTSFIDHLARRGGACVRFRIFASGRIRALVYGSVRLSDTDALRGQSRRNP